jgi:predicted phosphodiesterase
MEPIDNAKKYIKILAMSDTHDLHFRVDVKQLPKADIFIHAGDFTKFSAQA